MGGALIILAVTVATGLLLYYNHNRRGGHNETVMPERAEKSDAPEKPSGCCGMHAVCEKLKEPYIEEPVYYEDEELDRYAGRPAEGYDETETDEFREVLMTMRDDEVEGWLESLERRGIELPEGLRDEVGLFFK